MTWTPAWPLVAHVPSHRPPLVSAEPLRDVRVQLAAGEFALVTGTQQAVIARVDELIAAIESADRALARLPRPAMDEAAAKLAYVRYVTGRGWKRYATENASTAAAVATIKVALDQAMVEPLHAVTRFLASRPAEPVKRVGEGSYALPCAACSGDAVTLSVARVGSVAQEQMVVSSLSPVTVFRSLAGPRMADLVAILDAGDVAAVVRHLREVQPGGCDAWCAECGRIYCKAHYAVEAQWSGSWHEATYATCALGHEHTID